MARTGIGNMARTGTGPASYGHHSPGLWPLRDEIMLCTISGFTRSYRSVSWPSLPLRAVAHRLISDLDADYQLRETVGWRNRETFDARSVPRRRSLARHRVEEMEDADDDEMPALVDEMPALVGPGPPFTVWLPADAAPGPMQPPVQRGPCRSPARGFAKPGRQG
jgi:hypothetical protein